MSTMTIHDLFASFPYVDIQRKMDLRKSNVLQCSICGLTGSWDERDLVCDLATRLLSKIGVAVFEKYDLVSPLLGLLQVLAKKYECITITIDENNTVKCYPSIKEFEDYFNDNKPFPLDEFIYWTNPLNFVGGHDFYIYTKLGAYHYIKTGEHPAFYLRKFNTHFDERTMQVVLDINRGGSIFHYITELQESIISKVTRQFVSYDIILEVLNTNISFDPQMKLRFGPERHLSFGLNEADLFKKLPDSIGNYSSMILLASTIYYLLTKEEITYERIKQLIDYYYQMDSKNQRSYLNILAHILFCVYVEDMQNETVFSTPLWIFMEHNDAS